MIKNHISLEDTVMQIKGNIVSDMSGEKVMLSVKNGKYYNLGHTGGEIWDLIVMPITVQKLILSLMNIFDVEQSQCEIHVLQFLEHLREEGLIELN
jgi:hypothetical protein